MWQRSQRCAEVPDEHRSDSFVVIEETPYRA